MNVPAINNNLTISKPQAIGQNQAAKPASANTETATDFQTILQEKTGLKFSNHAIDRLVDRRVGLDYRTADRLSKAVEIANKKGADQSLVLLDQLAFLVSVRNKTVITALETANMREGVFTQIDSAIIG